MARVRRIVVAGHDLSWTRSVGDLRFADGVAEGWESVRVWPGRRSPSRLEVRFEASSRCILRPGYTGHDGHIEVDGVYVNLNLPSVVAGLIQAAMDNGWVPGEGGVVVVDGLPLWELAETRLTGASTV